MTDTPKVPSRATKLTSSQRRILLIATIALLLGLLALISPVRNTGSDSHFSLIVSQSLLERGTLALDSYRESHPELFDRFFWQTIVVDGHTYYNYPLAPTFVALPAVAAARAFHMDMLVVDDNHRLQELLSALSVSVVFCLVFALLATFVDIRASLALALVSTLGSTLMSTIATAYWNLDVAVIFLLLVLIIIARFECGRSENVHPYLLGLLLFTAYFTRPSAAIPIVMVFIYLFFRARRSLLPTAATSFLFFAMFVMHSQLTYGHWLPVYYRTSQWFNPVGILRPLYGVTFSPSRGLFIYSPFFLLVLFGGIWAGRRLKHRMLFALCALWLTLQVISVALTRQWHGGFSYGPRLLTDALPALVLMTAILWRTLNKTFAPRPRRLAFTAYLILGLAGILINSGQGIFNVKTALWNAYPNIDEYPELLFDWHYPQFLTTITRFHERRLSFLEAQIADGELELARYEWGTPLKPTLQTTDAIWHGWWPNSAGEWWSETAHTTVVLPPPTAKAAKTYALEIVGSAAQVRHMTIEINGQRVGVVQLGPQHSDAQLTFDGALMPLHNTVRISMTISELVSLPRWKAIMHLASYEPHQLGVQLNEIRLAPQSDK